MENFNKNLKTSKHKRSKKLQYPNGAKKQSVIAHKTSTKIEILKKMDKWHFFSKT